MPYPGASKILSRQQAHVVHTGKREGSSTAWPVEPTGKKKVPPPKLGESTPLMSNQRGVDSSLASPGPVTGQLRPPFPRSRAATGAAHQSQDGVTGTTLPFWSHLHGQRQFVARVYGTNLDALKGAMLLRQR